MKVGADPCLRKYAYLDPATADHVRHVAFFYGGATRAGGQEGWIDFIPNYFSEIPSLIERGQIPADVVFSMASPMDAHGYFSLSLGADYTMAAIAKARAVVLEVNPNVPFAYGNCHVHVSQVTALVESSEPVLEVGLPKIGPVQVAIGKYVADMIDDGSTLQIGYGGIPDAVVMQLTHKHDLGIHTEMIGDGILSLVECGAVTNRRKNYLPGKMVATFALGSSKLYRFMDRNPALEIHPVDFTNDPSLAGLNDNLVAINATLQIDLLGSVAPRASAPSVFGNGRPIRLRARRQPFARRQGVHRRALDGQGRHHFAHRAGAVPRHPRHHEQERHQLRRHRVRRGAVARKVGEGAGARTHRHRASGLPRRTDRAGQAHGPALTIWHTEPPQASSGSAQPRRLGWSEAGPHRRWPG